MQNICNRMSHADITENTALSRTIVFRLNSMLSAVSLRSVS